MRRSWEEKINTCSWLHYNKYGRFSNIHYHSYQLFIHFIGALEIERKKGRRLRSTHNRNQKVCMIFINLLLLYFDFLWAFSCRFCRYWFRYLFEICIKTFLDHTILGKWRQLHFNQLQATIKIAIACNNKNQENQLCESTLKKCSI